jgi:hypothetical protein
MVGKTKELLSALNGESKEEPLVLAVAFLFVLMMLAFLIVAIVVLVKLLGILFIPVISVVGSIFMVLTERPEEESE